MSDPVLEAPHHLDPDESPVEWRRLSRQLGIGAFWLLIMLVALAVLDRAFDDDEPEPRGFIEFVLGSSVQCIRTSSEVSPGGGPARLVPEEGAVSLGRCDGLGLASSTEPVTHPNGKRYIDTYRTEYYVRVAQFELEEGRTEYGPDEATELLRIVDEACYQQYAHLAPYPGSWNGCPGDRSAFP
ncbi:MAG: hypothetical protein WD557_18685 [Dehalococcoidia bacterium]